MSILLHELCTIPLPLDDHYYLPSSPDTAYTHMQMTSASSSAAAAAAREASASATLPSVAQKSLHKKRPLGPKAFDASPVRDDDDNNDTPKKKAARALLDESSGLLENDLFLDVNIDIRHDTIDPTADGILLQQQQHEATTDYYLSNLTDDLLLRIASYFDANDVLNRWGLLNRRTHEMAYANDDDGDDDDGNNNYNTTGTILWDALCQRLVDTKCAIATAALVAATTAAAASTIGTDDSERGLGSAQTHTTNSDRKNQISKRHAYRLAVADSKREQLTLEELCYNPGEASVGTVWSFRFKESAGSDWTAADPWYLGQPCRKMVFLRDHSMKIIQTATTSTTSLLMPQQQQSLSTSNVGFAMNNTFNTSVELVDPTLPMTWRLLTRPMDLPTRPTGSYIRIQVGGRDVPTYVVRRSPTGNWGFVLESCWGIYASFELPPKLNANTTTASTATSNSLLMSTANETADLRAATATSTSRPENMQDESMSLTNDVQWREAFLYNVGARVLPEGEEAAEEFDRFWHGR